VEGRFRYSDLKKAAPGGLWDLYLDEPVLIVCLPLLSEHLGFSSGSQREWSWGGASESLERTTILH
jgi:hypothetical protein